ncbi:hypothetical protein IKF63_02585 [Candidatus Saccharibacteria bacterium]|nr:hypothetical protein [Candidatus Saccharibacteria bacterium]
MSRIFRVSGNAMQFGRWLEPDPSFSGKIVVNEEDEFYGFCDEFCNNKPGAGQTRYVVGAFVDNELSEQRGIIFYKISNNLVQAPLVYIMSDLTNLNSGSWAILSSLGYFHEQGKAIIFVEEEDFSEEAVEAIRAKYKTLNDEGVENGNGELLGQIQSYIQAKGYKQ